MIHHVHPGSHMHYGHKDPCNPENVMCQWPIVETEKNQCKWCAAHDLRIVEQSLLQEEKV